MTPELKRLADEFNRYFTSANGVDVPARVSVSRDEWRQLYAALTAPAQVPMTYGCHCDLGPGEQPDGCVLDEDRPQDCVYARRGKTKATCEYWRPIGITQQEAGK